MKVASVACVYNEAHYLPRHLKHIPEWIDEQVVLVSKTPWYGDELEDDGSEELAKKAGATVLKFPWANETDQRNAGQNYLAEYDWIIVLDPDEFLDNNNWDRLKRHLETTKSDAIVVEGQYTYWKDNWVADPPRDYQMIIAVKPHVRFVDKRVINCNYSVSPVWLHHMSWRRSDQEVWNKISHYAHAKDFDIKKWYEEVWLKWKPGVKNVHPTTPATIHNLVEAKLPPELKVLGI